MLIERATLGRSYCSLVPRLAYSQYAVSYCLRDAFPFYVFATPTESILLSIITTPSPMVHHPAFAAVAPSIENPHAAFAPIIG
jgi:hypothetical protein